MKTDYNSYPIEIRKIVDKILSISLEKRIRIIYLALLKSYNLDVFPAKTPSA